MLQEQWPRERCEGDVGKDVLESMEGEMGCHLPRRNTEAEVGDKRCVWATERLSRARRRTGVAWSV